MKEYRSAGGERRLWFEEDEIEHIMDDELYKADMFPDSTHPSVDIESFLEIHLGVKLDLYAEWSPTYSERQGSSGKVGHLFLFTGT